MALTPGTVPAQQQGACRLLNGRPTDHMVSDMTHLALVRLAAIVLVLATAAAADAQVQAAPQDDAAAAIKAFARDLAELQSLVKQLDVSVAPLRTAPARQQPSTAAPQIFTVPQGEPIDVIRHENGWVLGKTNEGQEGWFQAALFPRVPSIEEIVEGLINRAKQFKEKYSNGPVVVTGFTLGLPATLNVDFEFR